jgi:hypothetical protein
VRVEAVLHQLGHVVHHRHRGGEHLLDVAFVDRRLGDEVVEVEDVLEHRRRPAVADRRHDVAKVSREAGVESLADGDGIMGDVRLETHHVR